MEPTQKRYEVKYDVALSFAGEQRNYVRAVAVRLRDRGLKVFFDEFENSKLWGTELTISLDEAYRERSKHVIIFISSDYASKEWTKYELKSALAAALKAKDSFILPVRFDNTVLSGLRPTVGYLEAKKYTPQELAESILEKIGPQKVRRYSAGLQDSLVAWRITSKGNEKNAFNKFSAEIAINRWLHPGIRAVYLSSSLSLAALELLINSDALSLSKPFLSFSVKIPKNVKISNIEDFLPQGWAEYPAPSLLKEMGTNWLRNAQTCLLSVPSAIVQLEHNYILNPSHSDFNRLVIRGPEVFIVDLRSPAR